VQHTQRAHYQTLVWQLSVERLQTLLEPYLVGGMNLKTPENHFFWPSSQLKKVNSKLKYVDARKVDWNVQRYLAHVWITSFVVRMHVAALATVGVRIRPTSGSRMPICASWTIAYSSWSTDSVSLATAMNTLSTFTSYNAFAAVSYTNAMTADRRERELNSICCPQLFFTRFLQRAAMLALQALYKIQQFRLSVRPSVCPSNTRRYCVKTTACSTVQFAL